MVHLNIATAPQQKQRMTPSLLSASTGEPLPAQKVSAERAQAVMRMGAIFRQVQSHPDRGWQACLLCVMVAWLGASLLVVLR